MGRTSSSPCQVYGGDRESRAGCIRKSVIFFCSLFVFFTDRPARSAAMPVLLLLSGPKIGFSLRRGDTLPR